MRYHVGDFSLVNTSRLGSPVEADNDQIEALIENDQHYTTREIADILKISKSINLLVKMKNVSFILQKELNNIFGQSNPSFVVCQFQ